MDLIATYWPSFISTVILPLITGIIISTAGWDGIKSRAASDAQSLKMAKSIEQIHTNTSGLQEKEDILKYYQDQLANHNYKDEILQKVVTQYSSMEAAINNFEKYRNSPSNERGDLSEEVIKLITSELIPIQSRSDLPNKPLILKTANNTFRVLFSVPMRIPPKLNFSSIPEEVTANIIESSKFGFTVVFSPISIEISNFNFTADSRFY
ncbi:hypothetical protein GCM10008107_26640 [Psychrosphaera saromensis]|uniref:Uncharacterized protein n=1 Tax=Psychrosphaera saromensis TaxID=716813 RepID=A0A2S7UXI6_9GAMM|nr:hypothetical protein [Psychrosphaera saromensis]PQJ53980.1 hypothetical protein BTO11_10145 [Psychrosphaera saromensis]GHB75888.1 hypothetical protein GCM10008107_26640 [Psychrosphaera saromensis]GLQ14533.1 hypothetical protein GCM10007917_19880 [Psychrosphaera saromensis]